MTYEQLKFWVDIDKDLTVEQLSVVNRLSKNIKDNECLVIEREEMNKFKVTSIYTDYTSNIDDYKNKKIIRFNKIKLIYQKE